MFGVKANLLLFPRKLNLRRCSCTACQHRGCNLHVRINLRGVPWIGTTALAVMGVNCSRQGAPDGSVRVRKISAPRFEVDGSDAVTFKLWNRLMDSRLVLRQHKVQGWLGRGLRMPMSRTGIMITLSESELMICSATLCIGSSSGRASRIAAFSMQRYRD